jgi:hypothetical protein
MQLRSLWIFVTNSGMASRVARKIVKGRWKDFKSIDVTGKFDNKSIADSRA